MPVIKEQKQYSIGPIGVARASEGGRITAEAIAQSANSFSKMFYNEGLRQAKESGDELGRSIALSNIKGIDPKTKKPVALNEMQGMGRAQAEAFQRVVNARFEQSIEEEIHAKASVLAEAVDGKPNSVQLFSDSMFKYLEQMSSHADGQYGQFIKDTGAIWTVKSAAALEQANIRRQKAQAKLDLEKRNAQLNDLAFDNGLSGNIEGFAKMQQVTEQGTADLATVLNDPSEKNKSFIKQSTSFALGLINNKMTSLSMNQRFNLIQSLSRYGSKTVTLTPEVQAIQEQILQYLPNDISDIMDFAAQADTFRKNLDVYDSTQVSRINILAGLADENVKLLADKLNLEAQIEVDEDSYFYNSFSDPLNAYSNITALRQTRDDYISEEKTLKTLGNEPVTKLINLIGKAEDQALTGLVLKAIQNTDLDESEIILIKNYLSQKNVQGLVDVGLKFSTEERKIVDELIRIGNPERLEGIANNLESSLKNIKAIRKKASQVYLDTNIDMLAAQISDGSLSDLDANLENADAKIGKHLLNIDNPKKYEDILIAAQGKLVLNNFLAQNKNNPSVLAELNVLASNPSAKEKDLLALSQMGVLDVLKENLSKITNVSDRTSLVTRFIERVNNLDKTRSDAQAEAISKADSALQYEIAVFQSQIADVDNYVDLERNRVKIFSTIKASSTGDPKVRKELFDSINKDISSRQIALLISSFTTEEQMNEALSVINNPNNLYDRTTTSLSKDDYNLIVNATKKYGDKQKDWDELSSQANADITIAMKTLKDRERQDAEKSQNQSFLGLSAINNAGMPEVQEAFAAFSLKRFGLEYEPADLFQNISKYLNAEAGSPEAQAGKLLNFYFKRSTEILPPSLKTFIKRGAGGGAFNGEPVSVESLSILWRNIGSHTFEGRKIISNTAIDSFDSTTRGVLDGLLENYKGGVPAEYLDNVRVALSDNEKIEKRLISEFGDRGVFGDYQSVYEIAADMIGSEFEASPQLHGAMEGYLKGLFASGVSREDAKQILDNHFDSYFSVDNYTVDLTGQPLNERTTVNLQNVFPNERDSVIRFAEQALIKEIGKEAYEDNYLPLTTFAFQGQPRNPIRPKGVRYFATESELDFKGKRMLFFFPTPNSTRSQAEFRLATLDAGGVVMPLVDSNVVIKNFGEGVNFDLQRFIVEENLTYPSRVELMMEKFDGMNPLDIFNSIVNSAGRSFGLGE